MTDLISLVSLGVSVFIATNIDDIFILMMFFSGSSFPVRQIVLGQYVGMGLLIGISVIGSLIPLLIPLQFIGLLGLVPIAIGIKKLIQVVREKDNTSDPIQTIQAKNPRNKHRSYLSFLTVTVVTFSNGGDNIGVYVPLFAQYSTASQVTILVAVFMAMTAVWCTVAYYLVNHPLIASRIRRIGHIILPFVLIGLGIYILSSVLLLCSASVQEMI
jgi:cadmium resistance protein CadD (predicted permease)